MTDRVQAFTDRIQAFHDQVIALVEAIPQEAWEATTRAEDWTVGATARHIGVGHYNVVELARMILDGQALPDWTMEQILDMANDHAKDHARCDKVEVLGILRESGARLMAFVSGLSEAQMDKSAYFSVFGGEVSVKALVETILLQSGGEHFASIQAADDGAI